MTKTIFIDEAGNTGNNLANAEQPAFVVATHQIPEAECRRLLDTYFPESKADEIKHTKVRKYPATQRGMISLMNALWQEEQRIAVYPVHKRFALFVRFFDYFVEPAMYETGLNAYAGAFNIQATNVAYVALPVILGGDFMTRLLELFEMAVRERSQAHLDQLWSHLEKARRAQDGPHRKMLDLLLAGKPKSAERLKLLPANPLDVAFSVMVALVVHWRRQSPGPFKIIHDESNNMAKNKSIWNWLSSPEQQQVTLGFGDYRDAILPLNVDETEFAKSHNYAGLQIADLLAGGMMEIGRYMLGDQSNVAYAEALIAAGCDTAVNNIWPDPDWKPPLDPGDPTAIDPLDYLAAAPIPRRS